VTGRLAAIVGIACALVLLLVVAVPRLRRASRSFDRLVVRLVSRTSEVAVLPKVKLLLAFSQTAFALPTIYHIQLPARYYAWTTFLNAIDLDISAITVPGQCLPGGYYGRLLVRGLWPLGAIAATVVVSLLRSYLHADGRSWMRFSGAQQHGALDALPLVLFVCFCLCASTSASIFAAYSCLDFIEDSSHGNTPRLRSYLLHDPSLQCHTVVGGVRTPTVAYERVTNLATVFVIIWCRPATGPRSSLTSCETTSVRVSASERPICVPLFFFVVLLSSAKAFRQRRATRLVRASAVLHREYVATCFWWEVRHQ
jgi:hypothetical protein